MFTGVAALEIQISWIVIHLSKWKNSNVLTFIIILLSGLQKWNKEAKSITIESFDACINKGCVCVSQILR